MKKIILLCILSITLFSCSNTQNTEPTTPTPFRIQTEKISDFSGAIAREKTAIIESVSNLNITSEGAGIIDKIHIKEGQTVKFGQLLAELKDNIANYDIALSQARNNLAMQNANIETTRINLDNSIVAAQASYDRALLNYKNLKETNSLQYENIVQKNNNILKSYNDSYQNYLVEIEGIMSQYLYEADKILGVTSTFEWANESWEPYLGAHAGDSLKDAKDNWNALYRVRGEIRKRIEENKNFTDSDTQADMQILSRGYEQTRKFTNAMLHMLQNNVIGSGLSQEMNTRWIASWNGFRNPLQANESRFVAWKSQTSTFLENYKKNELATKIAVETLNRGLSGKEFNKIQEDKELKLAYENQQLALKDKLTNAEISLNQAKQSLENAKKLKNTTLKQLSASRKNAEISLLQAQRNANRLRITSPINGIITKISVEVGENTNPGKIIAEVIGNGTQSIVEINPRMARLLHTNDSIFATIGDEKINGKIIAISQIAGKNMLSSVRIHFENADKFIGQAAIIHFEIPEIENENTSYFLPLSAVTIIEEGEGKIHIYNGKDIETKIIQLGGIYGKNIEVFTNINPHSEIILSDISNYNSSEQFLEQEKKNTL